MRQLALRRLRIFQHLRLVWVRARARVHVGIRVRVSVGVEVRVRAGVRAWARLNSRPAVSPQRAAWPPARTTPTREAAGARSTPARARPWHRGDQRSRPGRTGLVTAQGRHWVRPADREGGASRALVVMDGCKPLPASSKLGATGIAPACRYPPQCCRSGGWPWPSR